MNDGSEVFVNTEEISSETMIFKGLSWTMFVFIIVFMGLTTMLSAYVHKSLEFPFYIFSGIVFLYLRAKNKVTKRRNYEFVIIWLMNLFRRQIYQWRG
jgi:hypothetical protein